LLRTLSSVAIRVISSTPFAILSPTPPPPPSPLFPYPTLFRSRRGRRGCRIPRIPPDPLNPGIRIRHASRQPDPAPALPVARAGRSEEHTSELQSRENVVCRLLLEKKKPICHELSTPPPRAPHR